MISTTKITLLIIIMMVSLATAYWLGTEQSMSLDDPIDKGPTAHNPSILPTDSPTHQPDQEPPSKKRGINFAHFRVGNSNVKALLSDGPILWVGTSGGVIRYNTEKDEHRLFDIRSGLLSNGIFHLSKYGQRLMVGTYGGGLSLFDQQTETWENFNIQHGLADAFIYDVLELDNGDIWIATWSGANKVNGGRLNDRSAWETFTVENTQGGLPNDWVYGMEKGLDGSIWMATEGGLAHYKDGSWQNWKHDDGLGAAYELVKDEINFQRDPAKESSHHARQKVEMGLENVDVAYNPNYIVSLYVSPEGIVWCGTWGGGLARYDGTSWKSLTTKDGLPANHVFMLEKAEDGDLWIGTSGGLARYDGNNFKVLTTHDGLFANNVFSLTSDAKGSLWVGSYGGVSRLQGVN
ncbi:MAG: regulator [Candidatus Thiodiazotropha sp. (ex Lucinoma borealis)]|nr:regulator [Candidatus Thiodiazotropha sp. (ex Lucinoma borealis)]MCU7855169.1 regulator [Candidatus Thiodiazotropha sp. (ex Lucinoma borealis)]MCU7866106.1 regulator [Candidatus Thiodiazotropha sp. (ex Lucinoma borealis)]MCU7868570.1 regulator [Candidatus Thiodiazotropha sp. (ex Lucinoma borealis)]